MSNNPIRRMGWKNVMAALVTLFACLGFGGFVALIAILLSNGTTSMSEVVWARYVYLLTGIETITFTSVGWLFGKEVHREQAEMAQQQATEAMEQTKEAHKETMTMVQETMTQVKESQKDTIAFVQDAMRMVLQPKIGPTTFIHIATASNIVNNYTDIDHPSTNGHPNAVILVTPNWSPAGKGDIYNNHPIGVWYHQGKWSIFNQDKVAMSPGAAFNVMVTEQS
jgi:hypothetical protein